MAAYELRISVWSSDVCSSDLLSRTRTTPISSLRRRGNRQSRAACATRYRFTSPARSRRSRADFLQGPALRRRSEFAAERSIFPLEPRLVAARQIAGLVDPIVAGDAAREIAELRVDRRDVGVGPGGDLFKAGDAETLEQGGKDRQS